MNITKANEDKYKLINKEGKVIAKFRGKSACDKFRKEYKDRYWEELEVERI